jgi:hypothetical protein
MKTSNFPGRKMARRQRALERLRASPAYAEAKYAYGTTQMSAGYVRTRNEEAALVERIGLAALPALARSVAP